MRRRTILGRLSRLLIAVWVVAGIAAAGCGDQTRAGIAGSTGSPPPTATTTGILPAGVPTEGTRPPADALPAPAEPQLAPPPSTPRLGRIVPVGAAPEGVVVDAQTRTVAVAKRDPDELVLLNADTGMITGRTPLPGHARHLQLAAPAGPVLVPVESANALVRVDLPQGQAEPPILTGTSPHDAAQAPNGTVFVGNELGGTVTVLRATTVVKIFTDSVQPGGLAAVGTSTGLLDVRKNDLTIYDADRLTIVGSAPAGAGPTHIVADRHGRLIAIDTRGDTVRVFTALPAPREVGSIAQPGGPYGVTYDPMRDRLWVASSGTNEVVGYDMTTGTPREVQRLPTVQNPYTVGVDSTTGRLFVAGVTTGQLQIIDPPPSGTY
jgi:DNA-binding beta-propeller fold protein YncE